MSRRPTRLLIEDMQERIERIERSVAGVERETFLKDEKTADSVVRNLEVIGEAASRLPQTFKDEHGDIPWRQIVGLRHRIVHDYFDVDLDLMWTIVRAELPSLDVQLCALLDAHGPDEYKESAEALLTNRPGKIIVPPPAQQQSRWTTPQEVEHARASGTSR